MLGSFQTDLGWVLLLLLLLAGGDHHRRVRARAVVGMVVTALVIYSWKPSHEAAAVDAQSGGGASGQPYHSLELLFS